MIATCYFFKVAKVTEFACKKYRFYSVFVHTKGARLKAPNLASELYSNGLSVSVWSIVCR